MRLAIALLAVGVIVLAVGATAPGAWAGTFAGFLAALAGWTRLRRELDDRREARRRARRPGYIVGNDRRDA